MLFQYFLDAIIGASAQSQTTESCSGGSGGLIRLNASHVIHHFSGLFFLLTVGFLKAKFDSVSTTV